MNLTVITSEITQECFDWCKVQHFANDFQHVWILTFTFLILGFYLFLYINTERFIENTELTQSRIDGILHTMVLVAFILLIIFFVLWKFF